MKNNMCDEGNTHLIGKLLGCGTLEFFGVGLIVYEMILVELWDRNLATLKNFIIFVLCHLLIEGCTLHRFFHPVHIKGGQGATFDLWVHRVTEESSVVEVERLLNLRGLETGHRTPDLHTN